ncbi:hypothetical protein [Ktedonospora formicarum]|uniref:Mannanase galactose-binding domain-containing protein n=1 Tax=Ktedonospora formicarum TaxID=2778364 RepID=A0A8J3I0A2_9CHLR|nr:hypothetical protein [Ktedonospora formicarum]GHO43189.1 hypothetical protein KSX_13520 [Ktedonospora formicarum]
MGNEEHAISKAEEILIALGAKPINQATGDDVSGLRGKPTRITEDITHLSLSESEADNWLNSTPKIQATSERRPLDTDSLDTYITLSFPEKEQAIEESAKTVDYPDNPFEVSTMMPDSGILEAGLLESQALYIDSGGHIKASPMPGLSPSEGFAGLRRRRTDVFTPFPNLSPDPVLNVLDIEPDIVVTHQSEIDNLEALQYQTTPSNDTPLPLSSNIPQLKISAQSANAVRIPPAWKKIKTAQKGLRRGKLIALLVCLVLLGSLSALWLTNISQSSSQQAFSQTPGARTPTNPTSVATMPSEETRATSTASTPKAKHTPSATSPPVRATQPPQAKPTSPPASPMVYKYSFESGGTDSWASGKNISSVQNSTTIAKDGSHSLRVTFNSSSSTDYPYAVASNLPGALRAGQTVTAYVYVASGSNVQAKLYIQDQNLTWFDPGWTALDTLPIGSWYQLRFTLPSGAIGSATRVGVQFYGYNTVAYIDVVTW